jgi:hypothetical protein
MDQTQSEHSTLTIVGPAHRFPKVTLIEPTRSGYILLALEIDHRPPFAYALESGNKRRASVLMKLLAGQLRERQDVVEATVFKALLIPPGRGEFLKQRPQVKKAQFDLVLLVELRTSELALSLIQEDLWLRQCEELTRLARCSLCISAENTRRMGGVDHIRPGVFLFNYFYADHLEQNLAVWEYTAGWFQQETRLDNSVLLTPDPDAPIDYKIINHARWDRLIDILPDLLFKPSFESFVLANFTANNTAAMPVLYRRDGRT